MDHTAFILLLLSGTFGTSWSVQYYYVNENKTWLEAQSYCRRTYTDLATVGSAGDMTRLLGKVNSGYKGAVWIGLRKKWTWSTGEGSTYTFWYTWEPNEGNVDAACAVTDSGGWRDWYCSNTFQFYCFDDTAAPSSRFVLIQYSLTWSQAQIYCRYNYTDLPTIHNTEEQQQLLSFNTRGWIGLISERWSDRRPSTYWNWAQGQAYANTVSDACTAVMMNASGQWYYRNCDLQNTFICYGGIQPLSRIFHVIMQSKTWTEAQTYCRTRFTDLATVDSLKDMQSLMTAGYNSSLWIGLTRAMQSRWGWTGGEELSSSFSNWDVGWPHGSGQCVVTINGVWRDHDCAVPLYFVCYDDFGYILVKTSKSWSEAQRYCRASYSDLASIHSPWEQDQVTGLAGKLVPVWVGLFLDNWRWSDKWSLLFRNWATGQPSSGTGNCSTIDTLNTGRWTVNNCSEKHPFICFGDEDKKRRKQMMRVKLSSSGNLDLSSSSVQAAILSEIGKKLKLEGLANTKLSWTRVVKK